MWTMGKRGPAPRGEYADKSKVLSTRIRPDTRSALQAAAKRNGRSLSQEIESRLRRTLHDDDLAIETFGSVRNKRVLQMVGMAIQGAYNPDIPQADWLDDPLAFEVAVRTANKVLEALRPPGQIPAVLVGTIFKEEVPSGIGGETWASALSDGTAWETLKAVQEADPAMPTKVSKGQHLKNVIRKELGAIADRPQILWPNSEGEARKRAEELDRAEEAEAQR
jgi:hypothetical protein